jgi:hypothetical protein
VRRNNVGTTNLEVARRELQKSLGRGRFLQKQFGARKCVVDE